MRSSPLPSVAILAGGLGTRLRSVVSDRPKVLAAVNGRPFLSHLLDQVRHAGLTNVILSIGYRGDQVVAEFGERYHELALSYVHEAAPLGTGGALQAAAAASGQERLLALNGDSYFDIDLAAFLASAAARGFSRQIAAASVEDTARFGTVGFDAANQLTAFREKTGEHVAGWINAGIYLFPCRALTELSLTTPFSLEHDVFPTWLGVDFGVHAEKARFIDIGTPETFEQASAFFNARAGGAA